MTVAKEFPLFLMPVRGVKELFLTKTKKMPLFFCSKKNILFFSPDLERRPPSPPPITHAAQTRYH